MSVNSESDDYMSEKNKIVEIKPAATVLLIDDTPDLSVLVMERSANITFGGMWVFPGGIVDDADHPEVFQDFCVHRSDEEASTLLGIDRGGLAYYVAAIREAFEEAGILLALHRDNGKLLDLIDDDAKQVFNQHRERVNDGSVNFMDVVRQENLILDTGEMHYIGRFITPLGVPRRFDTRFFVSKMPPNQHPIHDDNEATNSSWLSPKQIITQVKAKQMNMMPPTMRMVEALAQFDTADAVMVSAAANLPDERMPMGGRASPVNSGAEPGWMRLRPSP